MNFLLTIKKSGYPSLKSAIDFIKDSEELEKEISGLLRKYYYHEEGVNIGGLDFSKDFHLTPLSEDEDPEDDSS